MKTQNIILIIDDSQFLSMVIPFEYERLHVCDEIKIFFETSDNIQYLLFDDSISFALEPFKVLLTEAIDNACKLHDSIKENIGFLWNQELSGRVSLPLKSGTNFWVGEHNLLWEKRGLSTWLYNRDNDIVLEIAPVYKWHYIEPKKSDTDYITYDEWIKNYKPLKIIKIDKRVAEEWLKKTEELLAIMD
ncbi:MAG: hypothetical protein NTX86_06145 [Candidatus Dependentiae bacterium]|nr:hypothetical protein [Candidatus Dependentiae bacterium]